MASNSHRAVFLDRDGVINGMVYDPDHGLVDSPQNPDQFELLPEVGEAIRTINQMGFLAVVISNQPGIAKGKSTPDLLKAVTAKMESQLAMSGARLDGIYYCLHHPEATRDEYRLICNCRKPKAGLFHQAAKDLGIDLNVSYMIGDGLTDVLAGKAAGCAAVLLGSVRCDNCKLMSSLDARPDYVVPNLLQAVKWIKNSGGVEDADLPRYR